MEDFESMPKSELIARLKDQEQYIKQLESKRPRLDADDDMEALGERLKQQQRDAARRENTLVHRLTTKEQELQDYMNQISEIKQAQTQGTTQLRSTLLDPAINIVFQRMGKEMDDAQEKLKQTQNELSAWKFTPDSQTGKKLMARCQQLLQENAELGKTIDTGRMAKLEGEIGLQKTLITEMKNNQSELDEFLGDLEEDVEGMQTMILVLQQQLRESKDQITALQEENAQLREGGTYSPKHRDKIETKIKTEETRPFKCTGNIKKEDPKTSKYSRSHSSNFTPMETSYDDKGNDEEEYGQGDGTYGHGEGGYAQYEDESYYEDYKDSYSPYSNNKDSKYRYDETEYENGYEKQRDRKDRKRDSHEPKHEAMDVDELTPESENLRMSNKIVVEKTNRAHSETLKLSKHSDEDAEMSAVHQGRDEIREKIKHEGVIKESQSSSKHHARDSHMEVGNEEVSSTVVSSTHHASHLETRDSHNKEGNKVIRSPHKKLTKDQIPDEVPKSEIQFETKSENRPHNENSITDKVSPQRTKSSIQLLIEPRPPKDNSPLTDTSSERTSPKPHLSPARTKSPKGNLSPSPHKDRSPSNTGNIDKAPVEDNSPHTTNSASKDDSPNKDRSPGQATSQVKEREPVLQKFLNGVTSTVEDIEDL